MRKLFLVILTVAAISGASLAQAQNPTASQDGEIPNMGRAPQQINGIGRADVRVLDQDGNPIRGAEVKLESRRTDGYYCESWNTTDERGVAVLPPIHMGNLRLIIQAPGFQRVRMEIPYTSLGEPVSVNMTRRR